MTKRYINWIEKADIRNLPMTRYYLAQFYETESQDANAIQQAIELYLSIEQEYQPAAQALARLEQTTHSSLIERLRSKFN